MPEADNFAAVETLHNGLRVEIRALRPEDREGFMSALDGMSTQSLHRRFFAIRQHFSEEEQSFFVNVDFINHVALIAVVKEFDQPVIIGGGRYIVSQSGQAEVAFAVVDKYQGQGIGAALMRHLASIARTAGLNELTAQVLPENLAMLKVFEKCGLKRSTHRGVPPRIVWFIHPDPERPPTEITPCNPIPRVKGQAVRAHPSCYQKWCRRNRARCDRCS
jgi:RimJ/RimL family protein N-acetyltransferase